MLNAEIDAVRSMPVDTRVSVTVLSIAGQEGRTLTIVVKETDLVSPAVVTVSEPEAPGIATPPSLNSTVATPVSAVVKVVLKVT
jgi:hypothetical protein